jgi:hypothetical protein
MFNRSEKYRRMNPRNPRPRCHCIKCLSYRGNDQQSILSKFQAKNGHLSVADPFRHPCGNGAIGLIQRRQPIALFHGFLISLPYQQEQAGSYLDFSGGRPQPQGWDVEWLESRKRLVEDYRDHEDKIDKPMIGGRNHFSLVCASHASGLTLLNQCLQSSYPIIHFNIQRKILPIEMNEWREKSKCNAHDVMNRSNVFTNLTHLQRQMVLVQSGYTGKLVSQLMNAHTEMKRQMIRSSTILHAGRMVANRVHNTNACEILADNRYGILTRRPLKIFLVEEKDLSDLIDWLVQMYPRIIAQLESDIAQLKRGLISINVIYENAEYTEFIQNWLSVFKKFCNIPNFDFQKLNQMNRFIASTPKLSQMEMSRCLGYSQFLKQMRIKMREMANQSGSISSFLAFIKIEPRLAEECVMLELSTKNHTNSEFEISNHVPSRCPVLGPLKKQYQDFIPRLGDIAWDVCRRWDGIIYKDEQR